MRKRVVIGVFFVLFAVGIDAEVRLVDNSECLAFEDPIKCCDGLNSGTCDGKVLVSRIMVRHAMIEDCQSFWQSLTCADTTIDTNGNGSGNQWLVDNGVCTQPQADTFKRLNDPDNTFMVTCNASRQTNKECRGAKNDGSIIMPRVSDCRKLYMEWLDDHRKARRNKGRGIWKTIDAGPEDPNNDPVGN